ncbi:MAG: chemotaxis-specific protein-glutamate methyltransferase CheB [Bdellovibrionaceae bacterium]|nr:chemotaxis-specific protein-glutamate methyltransferase CheB [Pseudobdellovibrionaceae bacterium]
MTPFIKEIGSWIQKKTGNVIGDKQLSMVENRLKSRALTLGYQDLVGYEQYFRQHQDKELDYLIGLLTTHHTFFFREFNHFEFLRDKGLVQLVEELRKKGEKKIKVWSAAASRGQEVYSLAMFLEYHLKKIAPDFTYEIWGTDIDGESILVAQEGRYSRDELKVVPQVFLSSWWQPCTKDAKTLKASFELKKNLKWAKVNLLELDDFLKDKKFHIIFCRNVFIYFQAQDIEKITKKFLDHLEPFGFLILGVSESLSHIRGLPVRSLGGSIYRHAHYRDPIEGAASPSSGGVTKSEGVTKKPFQVLVVDDSKTILALMKKILTRDQGFEICHWAANGKEAIDYLKGHPEVNMITLDIHMPELDGVGFLKEWKDRSRPILIVSAIDRADPAGPGAQALALGAFDYVEKPTVENLEQIGNEIRSKLKTGWSLVIEGSSSKTAVTTSRPTQAVQQPKVALHGRKELATPAKRESRPAPFMMKSGSQGRAIPQGSKVRPASPSVARPTMQGAQKSPLKKGPVHIATKETMRSPVTGKGNLNKSINAPKAFTTKFSELSKNKTSPPKNIDRGKNLQHKTIRTLIVDDSATIRKILRSMLESDARFSVAAEFGNPLEALRWLEQNPVDLVTLDIHMPEMDGVTLLKSYIHKKSVPTVMISSLSLSEGSQVLEALEAGAVDYIQKPSFTDLKKMQQEIADRLFQAAQAKVKRRVRVETAVTQQLKVSSGVNQSLIVIGSSTGGTEALRELFEKLPSANMPPILVAQHIPPVFSKALAERLNQLVPFRVSEAQDGMRLEPQSIYIAPGGKQMGLKVHQGQLTIKVTDDPPVNRHKPSVDYLFDSVADHFQALPGVVAVILTGMGGDGARALKRLHDLGAWTIGQDEASCVVYGMPRVAKELGALRAQLSLASIPQGIVRALERIAALKKSA